MTAWHEVIGDPTYADAILDRLVHNAHRIELTGESLRRARAKGAKNALTKNHERVRQISSVNERGARAGSFVTGGRHYPGIPGRHYPVKDGRLRRNPLLEILEERYGRRSTIVTSQLPVTAWHEVIGDPTYADAILDRLVHNAHRIELTGESLRRARAKGARNALTENRNG